MPWYDYRNGEPKVRVKRSTGNRDRWLFAIGFFVLVVLVAAIRAILIVM